MERPRYINVRQEIDITPAINGSAIDLLQNPETRFHALVKGQEIIEQIQVEALGLPSDVFDSKADKTAEELIELNRRVRRDLIKEKGVCDVTPTGAVPRAVGLLETATLYARGEALKPVGNVAIRESDGWVSMPISNYRSPNYYANDDK